MKKLLAVVTIAVLLAVGFFLQQVNGQTLAVRNHAGEGVVDKEQLILDIDGPLSELASGIANRDAALIFGIFGDPELSRYIRDGKIYDDISEVQESYAEGFAGQDHSIKKTFEFVHREYDIVSPTTVLFTGVGELSEAGRDDWLITYTILFLLEPEGWKAINMHISWD